MGRNAVCTANPAGGIQRDEVCKRGGKPVGLVQKGVSGAGKAGNLWQAAKLGTQLANSAVPAGSNPSFGQRVQNTILGSVLGMQNSKKLFGAKTPAGMAKATSALFGSIQQAQASGGIIGLLEDSSIGQYGARVARSAKNLAGTDLFRTRSALESGSAKKLPVHNLAAL